MSTIERLEKHISRLESATQLKHLSIAEVAVLSPEQQLLAYRHGRCGYIHLGRSAQNAIWFFHARIAEGVELEQHAVEAALRFGELSSTYTGDWYQQRAMEVPLSEIGGYPQSEWVAQLNEIYGAPRIN